MERLNRLWVVVAVLVVAFMAYSVGGWLNNVQQTMTAVDDLMVRMTQLEAQQAEISAALAGDGELAAGWDDQAAGDQQPATGEPQDSQGQTEEPAEPQASAGQTATVARQPAIVQTSQNGMSSEIGGKIRPEVALSASTSRPVTELSVRIGVPIAPQATGAVLAIRQSKAAWKGRNPSPTRNAAEIATGAPKPAAPSNSSSASSNPSTAP